MSVNARCTIEPPPGHSTIIMPAIPDHAPEGAVNLLPSTGSYCRLSLQPIDVPEQWIEGTADNGRPVAALSLCALFWNEHTKRWGWADAGPYLREVASNFYDREEMEPGRWYDVWFRRVEADYSEAPR